MFYNKISAKKGMVETVAKIHFLGTCSGTEPMEDMHHTAFVVETNGYYYWFDAGENSSRTAHLMGIDLLKIKTIFISHAHMDHIGGLGNLFWNIRKLTKVTKGLPPDKKLNLFTPDLDSWDGIFKMLKCTEGSFACDFDINVNKTTDGVLYEDENIKVTAFHNNHLAKNEKDEYMSYSYKIEVDNKIVVFSGDVKSTDDLMDAIGKRCDYLLMETGHHKVSDVCAFAENNNVDNLFFIHHGREIIYDRESATKIAEKCKKKAIILKDGMSVEI